MTLAIAKLACVIADHDSYGAVPDDTPVFLIPLEENCQYELNDPEELGVRLTLADLRAIVSGSI